MRKYLLIISFIITWIYSYGQDSSEKCALRIANDIWIEKFENSKSISEKIELTKYKMHSDSIYINEEKPDLYCDYKAKFLLNTHKDKSVILSDIQNKRLSEKMNIENISSIELIYLHYWNGGGFWCKDLKPLPRLIFIYINTDSKSLKKEIRKQ